MSKINSISFIIPAYNCAETITESVKSIIDGNYEPGDEIIIVDDASTDNTGAILEELQSQYTFIHVYQHRYNKNTAAAGRNTGIDNSKNNLIFCLDSDNILLKGTVKKLKEYLLVKNADAAAFGEIHFFRTKGKDVTHKWIFNSEIKLADCLTGYQNPLGSGNYLYTKDSWLKAGRYFEPTLINQTLDSWTFGLRQIATGTKMVTLPNTYYLHRYGHNSASIRENKKGNVSIAALAALLPFLHMIKDEDVEYIMGENRFTWFNNLEKRPILIKNEYQGKNGLIVLHHHPQTFKTRLLKKAKRIYLLVRLICKF